MQKVLIDCDPGHDDVFAIGLARTCFDIVGITTVSGNSTIENTTHNALITRDIFSLHHVPVVVGAAHPLDDAHSPISSAHGLSGLDGPARRESNGRIQPGIASDFIIELSHRYEGIWIIAIGPLTNLALACRKDPDFAKRIGGISIMGGSTGFGNVTATSEYNFWFDPIAATEVLASGARIKMCGLELTHQLALGVDFADSLRSIGTDASVYCAELFDFYLDYSKQLFEDYPNQVKSITAPLHDPCAVLALAFPQLFSSQFLNVVVEPSNSHTRGMSVADRRPWMRDKNLNIEVLQTIDAHEAAKLILQSFR